MNIQNPAPYPPQQVYTGFGNAMAQPPMQPSSYPGDFSQSQFQQPFPQTPQRPNQFSQQPGAQIPPHVYQQLQQQQHQQQGFARPQSRGNNGMIPGPQQRQSPQSIPNGNQNQIQNSHQIPRANGLQASTSAPQMPNTLAMATQMQQGMPAAALAQQAQLQNVTQQMNRPAPAQQQQQPSAQGQGQAQTQAQAQNQPPPTPLSPRSAAREKARVAVLLEINSYLLEEVVSLQSQGKAGKTNQQANNTTQQSPTSPSSAATDNANAFSPTDSTPQVKANEPSKEYADCMRRLQANLSYLAAIADAKKRPDGKVPPYPAIIVPPGYLKEVHELYRKLAGLFPEASQSKTNQAIAFASAQQQQQQQQHQQPGQGAMQQMGSQNMGMTGFPNTNLANGNELHGQGISKPGQGQG